MFSRIFSLSKKITILFGLFFIGLLINSANANDSLILKDKNAFLPPDEAFQLTIKKNPQSIEAAFFIAKDYYLYRNKLRVEFDHIVQKQMLLPTAEIKTDPHFGKTEIYHDTLDVSIPYDPTHPPKEISLTYQGCSQKGLCYAPITKAFKFDNIQNKNLNAVSSNSEVDTMQFLLQSQHIGLILLGFFIAGLLLSLTPCVLPMIPILSSIIFASHKRPSHQTRLKDFFLSLSYVGGVSFTYTLIGIFAGLSGNLISSSIQSPLLMIILGIVFILLALSMFDLYALKLPHFVENFIATSILRVEGGRYFNVFIIGMISSLVLSPCIAPPLAGAIIYINQSQDFILGGLALFTLSIGMSIPLLLIGIFSDQWLPKRGHWMIIVKELIGFILIAMGLFIMSPLFPEHFDQIAYSALLLALSIYLFFAARRFKYKAMSWVHVLAFVTLLASILLFGLTLQKINVSDNENIPSATKPNHVSVLPFKQIQSLDDLSRELNQRDNKMIMLDFYADWCVSCKEYEKLTFSNSKVKERLKEYSLLQVDVTKNNANHKALLKHFNLYGPPAILFFDKQHNEMRTYRIVGYKNASQMLDHLKTLQHENQ
ncbi:Thiol:disulfide interchange protein DsbD [Candidatus Methylopumilus planktonicus]|uniref:Thiol:disulfide interchange protein DsbD n=1 Tax=Candidatus Methylopumilus planktonicus TaxID=1581557 RepID=A0A0D6ET33_9PROT|nr:protein-disulfide reductase DsbD [Candidatus Methylopumilus planktonicus]CEZ18909.1 Thiol:disulfide interchange protein DsbD [Candidatus Methylopumilus planktonicus]